MTTEIIPPSAEPIADSKPNITSLNRFKNWLAWKARRRFIARPDVRVDASEFEQPVIVAGLFRTASGIGASARSTYHSLRAAGIDCQALDLSHVFGVVDYEPNIPSLKKLPDTNSGTLFLHLNGPETETGLYFSGYTGAKRWRVIGCWAWELEQLPPSWDGAEKYVSEIWTISDFSAQAIRRATDLNVTVVPPKVDETHRQAPAPAKRADSAPATCLIMADGLSSFERKNVLSSVDVYRRAFDEGDAARLIIKCRNLKAFPHYAQHLKAAAAARSDISLMTDTLTETQKWQLIDSVDILISMHRAEGYGLHLAEAMLAGKTVIATGWSANMSFMTEQNSMPVPYTLIPVKDRFNVYDGQSGARWADPDLEAASLMLREAAGSAELRQRLGEQARTDIRRLQDRSFVSRQSLAPETAKAAATS